MGTIKNFFVIIFFNFWIKILSLLYLKEITFEIRLEKHFIICNKPSNIESITISSLITPFLFCNESGHTHKYFASYISLSYCNFAFIYIHTVGAAGANCKNNEHFETFFNFQPTISAEKFDFVINFLVFAWEQNKPLENNFNPYYSFKWTIEIPAMFLKLRNPFYSCVCLIMENNARNLDCEILFYYNPTLWPHYENVCCGKCLEKPKLFCNNEKLTYSTITIF